MRPANGLRSSLAIAAIVGGLAGISWIARSTRAQDGKAPAPPQPLEAKPAESVPAPPPSEPSIRPEPSPAPLSLPQVGPTEPGPPRPDIQPPGLSPTGATAPDDDPEKNARAFVEQNRKVAQDELKKLKEEAERLRARLGKVEAGIRRWEALAAALDEGDRAIAMPRRPAPPPANEGPPPPPLPR